MSFNDDDEIATPADSGSTATPVVSGRVQLISRYKNIAPLEECKHKMMLELTGGDSRNDRPGLDLVAVLDVSGSMAGEKLEKLKIAMLFVIKKLSPVDRLSLVKFSSEAQRLCPLRQMTETSQTELENLIKGLTDEGYTNITAGLQTGLKVLNDRTLSSGRVVGIMLMSDGEQNHGGDAAQVPVGNVPVYTFGFGRDQEPKTLKAIADKSIGGTFSDVQSTQNLSIAFSMCLAGLLTVVVQDLSLTVTPIKPESSIQQVSAGSYPQSKDDPSGSFTITFGDLYSKEVRKVLVDLLLPAVSTERRVGILGITYSYSIRGILFTSRPVTLTIRRTSSSVEQNERPEVMTEETRLRTAKMIKEARIMANDNLNNAKQKIGEAQRLLEDEAKDSVNPMIEMLKLELQQLSKFMDSEQNYRKRGLPFALSSETSHDRQRFAARGDGEMLRIYATPRMEKYEEQAKSFDEDPSKPVARVDEEVKQLQPPLQEEVKEEVPKPEAETPSSPTEDGGLRFCVQSLKSILKRVKKRLCTCPSLTCVMHMQCFGMLDHCVSCVCTLKRSA